MYSYRACMLLGQNDIVNISYKAVYLKFQSILYFFSSLQAAISFLYEAVKCTFGMEDMVSLVICLNKLKSNKANYASSFNSSLNFIADDLSFLHFGTSSEVLDHLSGTHSGLVGRRHLCSIPTTTLSDIAASAIIVSSKITAGVSIGEDSLVYDSSIFGRVQIGSLSIVVGINIPEGSANNSCCFVLPDRHCLWEVPLIGRTSRLIVCCGLHDNPKNSVEKYGTFCGKPWKKVLSDLGIQESELWSSTTQDKCLWNAKIYPVLPYFTMLRLAMWLMGLVDGKNESLHPLWRSADRVSLEELHRAIDNT
ncbi:L-fucokinase [Dillenia turbinata]|uniref:L-fucokinase n=1 Tax=Dillenia turbinata TaxID=194707 RepID=A0AAN8UQA5_9MAGN